MKRTVLFLALPAALFLGSAAMMAQNPVCNPQPCVNNGCATGMPCYTDEETPAPCYIPENGCGYEVCNYGPLVDRYAYLADKYKNLGVSERQAAVANNNAEIIELQKLDNHFSQNRNSGNLTTDQQLKVQTAYGTIRR